MLNFKILFLSLISANIILSGNLGATNHTTDSVKKVYILNGIDSFTIKNDDPVLKNLDALLGMHCFNNFNLTFDSTQSNHYQFHNDSIPVVEPDLIELRLKQLDENTPFDLGYNPRVQAFIDLYAVKRRELTNKMLGLSLVYFPLFEETLAKYNLPLEFKYLAVVESALNPTIASRAGAVGLWQFMYATGKIYGLQVTSYVDDRMDPIKSTEAACKYFKFLYGMYGDWNLVLAAYNCGPGNVNKAIRRSGGKRDYWEIYPYLPRETRGYVPAFIAVNYVMNFSADHNLFPQKPNLTYFESDTLHIKRKLQLEQVAAALDIPIEQLLFLNPAYKKGVIPFNGKENVLRLPIDMVGVFVLNEETIYEFDKPLTHYDANGKPFIWQDEEIIYRVKSGDALGKIAAENRVTVQQLMEWNNLTSTVIHPGKALKISKSTKFYLPEKVEPIEQITSEENLASENDGSEVKEEVATKENNPEVELTEKPKSFIYYQIQKGDTLWDIAKQKGVPVEKLKELNKNLDARDLKPGDKIIIGISG